MISSCSSDSSFSFAFYFSLTVTSCFLDQIQFLPQYRGSLRLKYLYRKQSKHSFISGFDILLAANPCSEIALSTRLMVLKICSSFSRLNLKANTNCLAEDISSWISSRKSKSACSSFLTASFFSVCKRFSHTFCLSQNIRRSQEQVSRDQV